MAVLKSHSRTHSNPAPFIPDDPQRQAIEHVHAPCWCGGAGTGKTSVLRTALPSWSRGVTRAGEILALTYKECSGRRCGSVRGLLGGKDIHAALFMILQ